MDISLLALVLVVVFGVLAWTGHRQLVKGANVNVANGAVLLVVATLAGLLALGVVVSLDVW